MRPRATAKFDALLLFLFIAEIYTTCLVTTQQSPNTTQSEEEPIRRPVNTESPVTPQTTLSTSTSRSATQQPTTTSSTTTTTTSTSTTTTQSTTQLPSTAAQTTTTTTATTSTGQTATSPTTTTVANAQVEDPLNVEAFEEPVDALREACPAVDPGSNNPQADDGIPTVVEINLAVERMLGIDDVDESFAISAFIHTSWDVNCVRRVANGPRWPRGLIELSREDAEEWWVPQLAHVNTMEDFAMADDPFLRLFSVFPKRGRFVHSIGGVLTSSCDLNFYRFPFDEQTCQVKFTLLSPAHYVVISPDSKGFLQEGALSGNSIWEPMENYSRTHLIDFHEYGKYPQVIFFFKFKRDANFYLLNIFTPSFVLCLLCVTSIFLPADEADRATFACTVLLAIFFIQETVLNSLPRSSQAILASYYVLCSTLFAMACCIYASVILWFISTYPKRARQKIDLPFTSKEMVLFNLIDLFALVQAIVVLLGFTLGIILAMQYG